MNKNKMVNLNPEQATCLRDILVGVLERGTHSLEEVIVAAQVIKKLEGRPKKQENPNE